MKQIALLSTAVLFLLFGRAWAEEIKRGTDNFSFGYEVTLPAVSAPARLWLPLAASDRFQTVTVTKIDAPLEHRDLTDAANANRLLAFTVRPEDSGKKVAVSYVVERHEKGAYADNADVTRYLQPDKLVPNDPGSAPSRTRRSMAKTTR